MPDNILEVKNLKVSFGKNKVLTGVSFVVERGESLAIIGPNGSGKSVLFRALIGSLPYAGEIVWSKDARVGYVPQRIDIDRNLPLTLRDFLLTKSNLMKGPHEIEKFLNLVKLPSEFLDKKLGHLSGGQLQRALIAFALIGDPNVLLFDEPTAGVDLPREEQIYDTIHRLQDEKGLTVILVSHDLSLVYSHSTKVLCLNQSVVCYGTPHHVLNQENLHHLYGERVLYHHEHHGRD